MSSFASWWRNTLRFLLLWKGKNPFIALLLRLYLNRFLLDNGGLVGSGL
jgi:hypothetical protein